MGLTDGDLRAFAITVPFAIAGALAGPPVFKAGIEQIARYTQPEYFKDLEETGGMEAYKTDSGNVVIRLRDSGREFERRWGKRLLVIENARGIFERFKIDPAKVKSVDQVEFVEGESVALVIYLRD